MHTENVSYVDRDLELEGYLAYDPVQQGPRPAVLVAHTWGGQTDFERRKAEGLARLGYVGFALDLYGKGVSGGSNEESARLMQPFLDDRTLLRRRAEAALVVVRQLPLVAADRIAAIGFCFGGLCVLELARGGAGLRGVVSFHGLLHAEPELPARRPMRTKVLALHGELDPFVPPPVVQAFWQEMTAAGADWQMVVYGRAKHAFAHPEAADPAIGNVFDAAAERRSWQAMAVFLAEVLGEEAAPGATADPTGGKTAGS